MGAEVDHIQGMLAARVVRAAIVASGTNGLLRRLIQPRRRGSVASTASSRLREATSAIGASTNFASHATMLGTRFAYGDCTITR